MSADLRLLPGLAEADAAPSCEPIKVVLADDHELMRSSMRQLLEGEDDIEVVGEARALVEAGESLEHLHPDVLILAIPMPGGSRTEAVDALHGRAAATRIVLATMESDPAVAERALAAGAIGYVCKDRADVELPRAIRAAHRGERFISSSVVDRLDARQRLLGAAG